MISSHDIADGLETRLFGKKVFVFETIDSTNTCARLLAECGVEEGTVVYAEEQSSGRGRLKRKWLSDKGENLLFSVIFAPEIKERRYYLIPLMVSVCIVESIRNIIPQFTTVVKWPNDVLLPGGEKVGGILTELTRTYSDELRIIVGAGINVNQTKFSPEIAHTASSLRLASGKRIDRVVLLREILAGVDNYYEAIHTAPESVVERWRSYSTMFGKPVQVQQGKTIQTGICKDIDKEGALLIEDSKGNVIRILAGDVTSVAVNNQ